MGDNPFPLIPYYSGLIDAGDKKDIRIFAPLDQCARFNHREYLCRKRLFRRFDRKYFPSFSFDCILRFFDFCL